MHSGVEWRFLNTISCFVFLFSLFLLNSVKVDIETIL